MNSLLLALIVLSSCSKAESPKQSQLQQPSAQTNQQQPGSSDILLIKQQQPAYYRYLDREVPLQFVSPKELGGNGAGARYSNGYSYEAHLWNPIFGIDPSLMSYEQGGPGAIEYGEILIRLATPALAQIPPSPSSCWRENIEPTNCFGEIPYVEGETGIKEIEQTLIVRQSNGSLARRTIPADLYVFKQDTNPSDESDCPENYPCWQEVHSIVPKLPSSLLPAGKEVVIQARYTVTNPQEPQNVKDAKKKANEQICETLKNITWVQGIGTPPNWNLIQWPDSYSLTRITVEGQKK
ncbi:MAG: hypothetical protein HY747_10045 [Elusimicrobia bacterium]|nr:hypothetical protein [Elusimicrobiota bacterium]